ncbi:UNVERIFIED_ORG: hypothetical protein QFZ59_005215 [Bacillus sp. B2I3]|nr:hypothetical protein [Bacillus sp. B2I3]
MHLNFYSYLSYPHQFKTKGQKFFVSVGIYVKLNIVLKLSLGE